MEMSEETLRDQSNILKEIRDEIRSSRTTNPYSGAASGAARPSNTFIQSQMFMDKVVSGEWANMGWANAYTSRFESSWKNDLFASIGWRRSTNTMTQSEFQSNSAASLDNRISRSLSGVVSPFYTGTVQHLGQDIFENSQRFARFGDANAGIIGSGIDFGAANKLSRQVTGLSFKDMRMNAQDYSDTVSIGLNTSQYDHVRNNDDFIKKTKELASAVGDLTRTLHLSVKEIAQSMGAMRQYGIVDVADQQRTLMRIQGSAQIGGMSTGQAMEAFSMGMQSGHGFGIAAQTAGQVGLNNVVNVRDNARSGVVPGYIMGLGGGAEGIGQAITNAQMKYMSGPSGYMQFMGAGLGGYKNNGPHDALDEMMKGVALATGGQDPLRDMLSMKAHFMERMENIKDDPEQVSRVYKAAMDRRLRAQFGPDIDMTSELARNAIVEYTTNDMGKPAAFAYANMNYTQQGIFSRDSMSWKNAAAASVQRRKLDDDKWSIQHTNAGQFASGMKQISEVPAQLSDSLAGWWNGNGQVNLISNSPMVTDLENRSKGLSSDSVELSDIYKSYNKKRGNVLDPSRDIVEFDDIGSSSGYVTATKMAGGLAGGTMSASPLGGMLGSQLGQTIANKLFGSTSNVITGERAKNYTAALAAQRDSQLLSMAQKKDAYLKIKTNSVFEQLLKDGNFGNQSGHEAESIANRFANVAKEEGVSLSDVYGAFETGGGSLTLGGVHGGHSMYADELNANYKSLIGEQLLSGVKTAGINFATSGNAALLNDLISGDQDTSRFAQGRMNKLIGKTNTDLILQNANKVTKNRYGTVTSTSNKSRMSDVLRDFIDIGAERKTNQIFDNNMDVASQFISNSDDADLKDEFKNRYKDTSDLFGMLQGSDKMKKFLSDRSPIFKTMIDANDQEVLKSTGGKHYKTSLSNILNLQDGQFGIQGNDYNALMNEVNKPGANSESIRKAFTIALGRSPLARQEGENAKIQSDAQLFKDAADVLHQLQAKLGTAVTNGTKSAN